MDYIYSVLKNQSTFSTTGDDCMSYSEFKNV